ncbi:MAG: 30S ribosomal protein S6 [Candidatus Liptonbacteria bacterium]|nr:30S ribosomal protein S6 [Candidatus Liptonbacteria bacterium]
MSESEKQYELSLMLQTEEIYPEVLNLLKNNGASALHENALARFKLAYQIKKQTAGVFTYLVFEMAPDKVSAINRELEVLNGVLRFLIITPPIKQRVDRGMRGPRDLKPRTERPKREITTERKEPRRESGEAISNELLEKKLEEILK